MTHFSALRLPQILRSAALTTLLALFSHPILAAEEAAPRGAPVTVFNAAKRCFDDIVEVSGIVIPREETAVRPDRPGLKITEVLVEAGDTVTAGQPLARAAAADGGSAQQIQAPVGGLISSSSAIVGALASPRGEALFSIIARNEFDLVGLVPARDIAKLAPNQPARIKLVGADEAAGAVRLLAPTIEPNSQLGRVFVGVTANGRLLVNSSARAQVKTGESCGLAVPITAVLYGSAGTVVQVVRRARVETRRVELGLMSGGQVEIRDGLAEGDVVVARAGALLREGDPVRPFASAETK